jgi:hypothetical protein
MGHPVEAIKQPRTDEKPLWEVLFGLWGYPAVLVANQLKLFELLAEKPITLDEVCRAKQLAKRPAEALLSVCMIHAVSTYLNLLHLAGTETCGERT